MISSGCKTYRDFPENSVVLIQYIYVCFHSMVDLVEVDKLPPKYLSYGLASQTNSQNALCGSKMFDHFLRNPCLIRNSRPRRNYNFVIFSHIFQTDLIISVDIYRPLTQFF